MVVRDRWCTWPGNGWLLAIAAAGVVVAAPLPPGVAQSPVPAAQDDSAAPGPARQLRRQYARRAAGPAPRGAEPARTAPAAGEIREPSVALSAAHRATCLRFLGDVLPDAELSDAAGQRHALAAVWGPSLTVVVCWNAENPYALDQFQEIPHELAPLREWGVSAAAIHVGPPPADFARLCQQHGDGALCLVDPQGAYFALLATRRLPRTYLLDAHGTILWLDLEYSCTTRHDLRNAVRYYLQKPARTSAAP